MLALFLLPSCDRIDPGSVPGPDRYYKRLAQNRGKWTAINIHFHQEDAAGAVVADTVFPTSADLFFEVDENDSYTPLSVQLPIPVVVRANGQPFVVLNTESISAKEYLADGSNGVIVIDRGGFRSLEIDWKNSTHFVGKLSSGDDHHYTLFDAFTP